MAAPNAKPTSTPEWASTASTVSPWAASTAYSAGDLATNGGNVYEVVTGGTSAGSGGPTGTGTSITDNTVTWRYLGKAGTAGGITEPSTGRKQTGWLAGEKPPHGYFNWLSWLAWKWTAFLDTFNEYLQIWRNAAVFEGPPAWASTTAYVVGEYVLNDGKVYVCTVAGTSAGSGGPTGTGTGIVDGTVTWDFAQLPFDVEVPARTRAGLEATQATTNAAALTATGNGTGAGMSGTGGSSNGSGGTFTGGATNGPGVTAQGTGTGAGVSATGGTGASATGVSGTAGVGSGGAGVTGQGEGAGAGVTGTGGGTAGAGVAGIGGATGGVGVTGVGGAGGATGGRFTGSGATGNGVEGIGTGAGDGVRGDGAGTGVGGRFTGGATAASGVVGVGGTTGPGGTFSNGTASTGAGRTNALVVTNGDISMAGVAYPDGTTAISNAITPANIPKALGLVQTAGGGVVSVVANTGFNIASVAVVGIAPNRDVRVTMATAMASANYVVQLTTDTSAAVLVLGGSRTTTTFDIRMNGVDLGAALHDISVTVYGRQ